MLILTGLGFRYGWSDIPFNKALWTLSYNLVTSGTCIGVLTGIDELKIRSVDKNPLAHLGMNAILFFVLSDCGGLLNVFLQSVWVSRDGRKVTLTSWFRDDFLSGNIFIYALQQLFFYTCLTTLLYRRKIFFKIS
jgi:predicted acyltransferase